MSPGLRFPHRSASIATRTGHFTAIQGSVADSAPGIRPSWTGAVYNNNNMTEADREQPAPMNRIGTAVLLRVLYYWVSYIRAIFGLQARESGSFQLGNHRPIFDIYLQHFLKTSG
jgi:hypothetical protein